MTVKKIASVLFQLFLIVSFYFLIEYFLTQDMLETDKAVPQNQFSLKSVQFNQNQIVDFATNDKQTLLYFFAPWCQICHLSMPNLRDIHENYADKVNVIAVALDYKSTTEVTDFLAEHELNFPVFYGNQALQRLFKVNRYPSYYLIQPNGVVTDKVTGYTTEIGMKLRLNM